MVIRGCNYHCVSHLRSFEDFIVVAETVLLRDVVQITDIVASALDDVGCAYYLDVLVECL